MVKFLVGNENLDVDEEEGDHKRKIVLKKRSIQKIVTLPNGTTFTARCERISRKQLPSNIRVKEVRAVGMRNRNCRILSVGDINLLRKISGRYNV